MTGRTRTVRAVVVLLTVLLATTGIAAPAGAEHGPPVITSPADGSTLCVPGGETTASVPVVGTTNPDAAVAVRDGGTPVANGTADGAGAFSVPVDLAAGSHVLDAVATVGTEPGHDSDPSAPVSVEVVDPNGALGAVTKTLHVISPRNGDGYRDSVTFAVPVATDGTVHFEVRAGATLIRSSAPKTVLAGANHTWLWKGKTASNAWVASGTYTVVAVWQQSGCAIESDTTTIKIDNWAPTISAIAVSTSKFYPARNDAFVAYKDTVTVKYGWLSETAHVSLYVFRRGSSTPVRKISLGWKSKGTKGGYRWNGRTAGYALLPEGTYDVAWRLLDGSRNERISARKSVTISHWHVVPKTSTLRTNGNAYLRYLEAGCGIVSDGQSDWAEGVWLATQDCVFDSSQNADVALAEYNFGVPNAIAYSTARLGVYGYTLFGTPAFGDVRNNNDTFTQLGGSISATSPGTRWFSSFSLNNRVTSQRRVIVSVFSYSPCDCNLFTDYDIRWVYLQVTYGVLAPQ